MLPSEASYPELHSAKIIAHEPNFIIGGDAVQSSAGDLSSAAQGDTEHSGGMMRMPSGAVSKEELIGTLQQQLKDKEDKEELYKLRIFSLQQQIDLYDQHVRSASSARLSSTLSPAGPPVSTRAPQGPAVAPTQQGSFIAAPTLQQGYAMEVARVAAGVAQSVMIPVMREKSPSVRSDSTVPTVVREISIGRVREASSSAVRDTSLTSMRDASLTSREGSTSRQRRVSPAPRQYSPPSRLASPFRQLSRGHRPGSAAAASARVPVTQAQIASRLIRTASPVRAAITSRHQQVPTVVGSGGGTARNQPYIPVATAGVIAMEYLGIDRNRDGVPDALQFSADGSPGQPAKRSLPQAPTVRGRLAEVPAARPVATRTVPVLKRLSELSAEQSRATPHGRQLGQAMMTPTVTTAPPTPAPARMVYPAASPPLTVASR